MSTYHEYSSRVIQSSQISIKSNGIPKQSNIDQEQRVQNISKQIQIFLMAIELERLTDENKKQKNKIKTMEDEKFNNQNLEQQIIDLTNKLNSIEVNYQTVTFEKSQIEQYYEELVRYKETSENQETILRQEVENLRLKLRDFEQMKQNEIQTILRQKDSETQNLLQTQIHENDLNWQQQKEFVEKELLKIKELYYQKQKENDELRINLQQQDLTKYRNMENILLQQKNDLERQNQIIQQYQFENQELKQRMYNVERIEDQLQNLETDLQYANEYIAQLEQENQEKKQQNEILQDELEKLRYGLSVKSQDLEEYKMKCLKYERISQDSSRNKKSLDEKFILMQQEIERLQLILRQKNMEVENISKKITDNAAEKQRLNELEFQLKQQEKRNQENEKKNQDLQQKLVDQTKKCTESEKQFNISEKRCQQQEQTISERIQAYKVLEEKFKELETRYNNLLQELDKINKLIQIKNLENENQKNQIENSKIKLADYDKQLNDLYEQINLLEKDIEKLKRYEENCRVLSLEIDRLTDINQRQEEELKQWRLQYANEGSLNKRIGDQLQILFVLMMEVESLRETLILKDKQIEEIRKQNLAPYKDKKK